MSTPADDIPLHLLPPPLLKAIKANLVTEHFGWSPESFVKQGMDLANVVMYAATKAAEDSLMDKDQLDDDEVQKGIYKLETLLENAIDKAFDIWEMFMLRNAFEVPVDAIPYIVLAHQESIDPALKGADDAALEEYQAELKAYERALEEEQALACTAEYTRRRLERVHERAEEVGYLKGADPLPTLTQSLSTQLTLLRTSLSALLATPPVAASSTTVPTEEDPWGASRAAYVNWGAGAKIDAVVEGTAGGSGAAESGVEQSGEREKDVEEIGTIADGQALLRNLGAGGK